MRKDIPRGAYTSLDITNSSKQLIADKLQFFADCLRLVCLKSGEFFHFEPENHLTLVRNLKFYADGEINSINPKLNRTKNTIRHVQFIVRTHPLFEEKDEIINIDEIRANSVKGYVSQILAEPCQNKGNLVNIRALLEVIDIQLAPTYVEDVIQSLYRMVRCEHQLNYHKSGLEYLARLIFAHFHSQGHSRGRIHDLINRLLSKKVGRQGDNIYTDVPLKRELYDRLIAHNRSDEPFDQQLFDDIQGFLDSRTLKEQIEGFVYLDKYDKYTFSFIFRVDGVMTWPQEFELLGLKFIDINHFIKEHSEEQLKYAKDFLARSNHSILVEVEADAYSQDEAVHEAIKSLKIKLGTISRRANGRFALNHTGYTFYPAAREEFWINTMPEPGSISKFDIENIEYKEKTISESIHKEFYLQLESILTEGYLEDNVNVSLHHLRKFMQVLFDNIDSTGINHLNGISDEIRVLAYLLVQFEKERYIPEMHLWALNMTSNMGSSLLDEEGEYKKLKDQIRINGTIPLSELIKSVAVKEHVKFEARKSRYFSRSINYEIVFNYYVRQLLFIKQYRDKHEHASSLDDQIARKLNLFSYKLMKRLLDCSFKQLNRKDYKGLPHNEILRKIVDEGQNKVGF